MNIALPALLIFLIFIPGFIFRRAFYHIEDAYADYTPTASKTVYALLIAILLHSIWIKITNTISPYKVDYSIVLTLLMGHSQAELTIAKQNIERDINPIFWYFISLYLFAWFSAISLRYLVISRKLDSKTYKTYLKNLLLINNEWYYIFNGYGHPEAENIITTVASVIVEIGSTNYLYIGFIDRYGLTNQGELQNLMLKRAYRRNLDSDKTSSPTQLEEKDNFKKRFYKVDGDYLIIEYSQIKTLNISYLKVEPLKENNSSIPQNRKEI